MYEFQEEAISNTKAALEKAYDDCVRDGEITLEAGVMEHSDVGLINRQDRADLISAVEWAIDHDPHCPADADMNMMTRRAINIVLKKIEWAGSWAFETLMNAVDEARTGA